MQNYLKKFIPNTLKNKLIVSFLLLIIFPFTTLNIYNFQNVEKVMRENVSKQVHDQLGSMNRTLEDLMDMTFHSMILLRQDTSVIEILNNPDKFSLLERYRIIKSKFESINNSFFLSTPPIYFTLLDMHGNVYTSFQTRQTNDYNQMTRENWYADLMNQDTFFRWVVTKQNYVHPDISDSKYLLSLDSKLEGSKDSVNGIVRVSIDFAAWFNQVLKDLPVKQDYFIITDKGEVIVKSNKDSSLPISTINAIKSNNTDQDGYFDSKDGPNIINYNYIETLSWYMVNRIPLEVMYNEVDGIKKKYFVTFSLILLVFILITLMITTKFTHPLKELQHKMTEVVHGKLKTSIPEHTYSGEILALTKHFNKMVRDLDGLIEQLKVEERQKEAIKYKMLLNQMNPHFLNNTLNTVKWIALRDKNGDISEICASLGRILETSLNNEIELIRLSEEIDLLRAYIYIQNYRYKGQFQLIYKYDERLNDALVPKLCLQPIVENSINHGFVSKNNGLINVQVYQMDNHLFIEVIDDGIGIEAARKQSSRGTRIGLENIKERLDLLFKDENGFSIKSSSKGTIVTLNFPLIISPVFQEGGVNYVDSTSSRR